MNEKNTGTPTFLKTANKLMQYNANICNTQALALASHYQHHKKHLYIP